MRAISCDVRAQLERLRDIGRQKTRFRKPPRRTAEVEQAAAAIASSGEWAAIPHLAPLAVADHAPVAAASLEVLAVLLARLPIQRVAQLDRRVREGSAIWSDLSWFELPAGELKRVTQQQHGPAFLQVAMCHPSGYVREAAIRLSNLCSDGGEIRFLLVRLNDWVQQVQQAALEALRARLTPVAAKDLVAALPVLDSDTASVGRRNRSARDEIETFLCSDAARAAIESALRDDTSAVRRSAYRRALGNPSFPRPDVLNQALRDRDPFIRLWATRHIDPKDTAAFAPLLATMLRDPLGTIRLRSLELALEHQFEVDLRSLLTDTHPGVRSLAQATLLTRDADIVAIYRQVISSARNRRLAAALSGLAESAGGDAESEIRRFLTDSSPAVRRAVLHAMSALESQDIVTTCLGALNDPAPHVAHAARALLTRRSSHVSAEDVWKIAERATQPHARIDALDVLAHLDYWTRLPYLLRATHLDSLRQRALLYLARWVATRSRRFSQPTQKLDSAIRIALRDANVEDDLRQSIAAALRFPS